MTEEEEEVGGEELEVGAEEMVDEKSLTKRDIHTLNEQRRRDIIKVWLCNVTWYILISSTDDSMAMLDWQIWFQHVNLGHRESNSVELSYSRKVVASCCVGRWLYYTYQEYSLLYLPMPKISQLIVVHLYFQSVYKI